MSAAPSLLAALLLGLAASAHCAVMCGGLTSALSLATARAANGKSRLDLLLAYQLGRIGSYMLAGALAAWFFAQLVNVSEARAWLDGLRMVAGGGLLLGAFAALGWLPPLGLKVGQKLWSRLAPLGRKLLPVRTLRHALAFGALWGWLPCGLVYTLLLIAAFAGDPIIGAATMMMFGLGTLPGLLGVSLGAQKLTLLRSTWLKNAGGTLLLLSALLTLAGPGVVAHIPALHQHLPAWCLPPP
ncbi:sulfite exporter TauE/SafE family protein [Sinimarinibacterium sp. NLF-5-8]|uniref:sulfite exporter TauE/SafE family protein n=1 Tax=Sinimarinibacterium sp. NLF-5-8 TaxID=2698684 RepID=UPI00137BFCA5|nr:sulfite exporter TauE/SafE family protein [Sinimarinibacterium sp. NLF-5-8]QHS10835.1 sulfite exporter TauE/SafE family protein [Sinimarinibacterium sp. NLF-5-8]